MAKKKDTKDEEQKADVVVELEEPVQVSREYTEGTWLGHAHYQCTLCPFDVLNDEQIMLQHIQMVHRPQHPAPKRAPTVFVADKRGNDVTSISSDKSGDEDEVFEVELKEVNSVTDEQGNEHKTYTIKEE